MRVLGGFWEGRRGERGLGRGWYLGVVSAIIIESAHPAKSVFFSCLGVVECLMPNKGHLL